MLDPNQTELELETSMSSSEVLLLIDDRENRLSILSYKNTQIQLQDLKNLLSLIKQEDMVKGYIKKVKEFGLWKKEDIFEIN